MTNVGRNRRMICGKGKPRASNDAVVMNWTGLESSPIPGLKSNPKLVLSWHISQAGRMRRTLRPSSFDNASSAYRLPQRKYSPLGKLIHSVPCAHRNAKQLSSGTPWLSLAVMSISVPEAHTAHFRLSSSPPKPELPFTCSVPSTDFTTPR